KKSAFLSSSTNATPLFIDIGTPDASFLTASRAQAPVPATRSSTPRVPCDFRFARHWFILSQQGVTQGQCFQTDKEIFMKTTRRSFLKAAAALSAAPMILPSKV